MNQVAESIAISVFEADEEGCRAPPSWWARGRLDPVTHLASTVIHVGRAVKDQWDSELQAREQSTYTGGILVV